MRIAAILLILLLGFKAVEAKRFCLGKRTGSAIRTSAYAWIDSGQSIGVKGNGIDFNFDEQVRAYRLIGIKDDILIVRHVTSLYDTIITRRRNDFSFRWEGPWELGNIVARHKGTITERYQIPYYSDTLHIPIAQINYIRAYRRTRQHFSESSPGLIVFLPPMFAYCMYVNLHPARKYRLKKWGFAECRQ